MNIKALLKKHNRGINLDVGCGNNRQNGFITLDRRKLPNVDIVWDITVFPWPLPNNCCSQVLMSHIWEHIEPKFRIDVINEIWRIMKDKGELWLSSPYALSFGASQDPTHYPCPNEATFTYFDPSYSLYNVYKPNPWKLIRNDYQMTQSLEIIMSAIKSVPK